MIVRYLIVSTLEAPTNVLASDGTYTNKVQVSFSAVSGASAYEIWRSTNDLIGAAAALVETTNISYADTAVSANVAYYYWVRAKNQAVTSDFSLADSGYASPAEATGSVDLSVLNLLWLPAAMSIGEHPGAVSVQLINYGPDNLASPNTRVAFDFYLSADAHFGDTNDVYLGNYSGDKTLGASTYTTVVVPASGRQGLIVPATVTSGTYNVFARVRHAYPSTLMDPDESNNYVMREGAITVVATGGGGGGTDTGYHLISDYDGDGKSDVAVYQKTSGQWEVILSGNGYQMTSFMFGGSGYDPVLADYDGDGKSDPAVCKTSTGEWELMLSGSGYQTTALTFGETGVMPVPMDYDGDGKGDPTIYRENAGEWEIMSSADNYASLVFSFGGHGRTPAPADYDGDGLSDLATYRDANGDWAVMFSSLGYWTTEFNFGGSGATPVPADYDGDGKADPGVYRESSGEWSVMMSRYNYLTAGATFGGPGWVPVPAVDYDGDGKTDVAIYNAGQRLLKVLLSGSNYGLVTLEIGGPGYEPVQ